MCIEGFKNLKKKDAKLGYAKLGGVRKGKRKEMEKSGGWEL